jgi:hypothetical protein
MRIPQEEDGPDQAGRAYRGSMDVCQNTAVGPPEGERPVDADERVSNLGLEKDKRN